MTEFFTLFSSSAGNSACLSHGDTVLLIDAGGSCKKILSALCEHGIAPGRLSGIVLTHEHSDHISGLRVLVSRTHVPVYGTEATLRYLLNNSLLPPEAELVPIVGESAIGDILVRPFSTSHDAADTCGYTFALSNGQKVGFATDLGVFTDTVFEGLCGCELVILESNYDRGMLEASGYPYPLIRRIKSETGHLSNEECAAAAVRLVKNGVHRLVLAHTSKNSNLEELAYHTTMSTLAEHGIWVSTVKLEVAPKFSCSPVIIL